VTEIAQPIAGGVGASKTVTIYPKKCEGDYDPRCQYRNAPDKWNPSMSGTYIPTTNLIVRGWGTYFELDHNYQSVKFNGYGNCGFFLYSEEWFRGKIGKFRGYYNNEMWPQKMWNSKNQNVDSMCRNFNMTWFGNRTGSLETNDTCWGNASRRAQNEKPGVFSGS